VEQQVSLLGWQKKKNKTKEKVIHGLTYLAQKFENMKFSCFNPCKNRVSI
jgi:hypothetical protein